ncbi:hypothetical protein CF319_g5912 [Tilletia indica]|nr:hypothetical protein CF319_g5912 [Tilletia indica]
MIKVSITFNIRYGNVPPTDVSAIQTQFDPTMVHLSDFTEDWAQAAKNRLMAKKGSADKRRSEDAMIARAKKKMEIAEWKKAEAAAGGTSASASTSSLASTPTPKKRVVVKKAPPKKPSAKGKEKAKTRK